MVPVIGSKIVGVEGKRIDHGRPNRPRQRDARRALLARSDAGPSLDQHGRFLVAVDDLDFASAHADRARSKAHRDESARRGFKYLGGMIMLPVASNNQQIGLERRRRIRAGKWCRRGG